MLLFLLSWGELSDRREQAENKARRMRSKHSGHTGDIVFDQGGVRIWVERDENKTVIVEYFENGYWKTV
jgi:hypothetical protein